MKTQMYALALSALVCIFACQHVHAQDAEKEIASMVKSLAEQLISKQRPKVTALDFTDIQNRPNELGRYLAEQVAVELVAVKGITVLDRTNIASIMAEHQLTAEGLVKPENAKKLGQFANVDAILIGNLAGMEDSAVLTIKAISTETAEIVAAGRAKLPLTKDLRRMLDRSVAGNSSAAGNGNGAAGGAVAAEGAAITTKQLGPLTLILQSVAGYSVTDERRQATPAVRFTFDLENRDLQRFVSVAANQRVQEADVQASLRTICRGDLVDSDGATWNLVAVRGISLLACFEQEKYDRTQRNPSEVIDYVRSGQQWEGAKLDLDDRQEGKLWTGSMTPIPPGKSIRASFEFVRSGAENQRTPANLPAWFQLDAELIVGTFAEGEDPLKSKTLTLQTLSIDRVMTSEEPKGP